MVKIAELIDGKIICGDFAKNDWCRVFSIRLAQGEEDQVSVVFKPLILFGEFEEVMHIDENKYIYIYNAGPNFIRLYRQQVINLKARQSGIIPPSATDISNFKDGKAIKVR